MWGELWLQKRAPQHTTAHTTDTATKILLLYTKRGLIRCDRLALSARSRQKNATISHRLRAHFFGAPASTNHFLRANDGISSAGDEALNNYNTMPRKQRVNAEMWCIPKNLRCNAARAQRSCAQSRVFNGSVALRRRRSGGSRGARAAAARHAHPVEPGPDCARVRAARGRLGARLSPSRR